MPYPYRRRTRRVAPPSRKRLEAFEQAAESDAAIKVSKPIVEVLPTDRLFSWMAYPVQKRAFQKLLEEKFAAFPWLATAWADFRRLEGEYQALRLATKKWAAPQAAQMVRDKARQVAAAESRARSAEYTIVYLQSLFPFLIDFVSEDLDDVLEPEAEEEVDSGHDPARVWLTPEEYKKLKPAAKYQLALDRYWQRNKTPREIGRDYERFVGFGYENQGFSVRYQGIVDGFADLGRDVVAKKDGQVHVVQCKYWSRQKLIHEKHICQLFGTVTEYRLDHPDETVTGVFVTLTALSDRARQFAEALEIEVREGFALDKYPVVKCNVSKRTGEKIYHLPFDQ